MLGIVDDFFAVVFQVGDGFGNEVQVFFEGDAERPVYVMVPALTEDGDYRCARVHQFADVAVFFHRVPGEPRGTESGQLCML